MTDGKLSLPFPTTAVPCPTCHGKGDVNYLAARPDVIGGKRIVCPVCEGHARVPVKGDEQPRD